MAPPIAQEGNVLRVRGLERVFLLNRMSIQKEKKGEIGLSTGKNKRNLEVMVILSNLKIFL